MDPDTESDRMHMRVVDVEMDGIDDRKYRKEDHGASSHGFRIRCLESQYPEKDERRRKDHGQIIGKLWPFPHGNMEAGREDADSKKTNVRRGIHPGKSALFVQGPETMIAEETVVQIGDSVDELGDIRGEDIIFFTEVAGCRGWAPVGFISCSWIWDRWKHLGRCVGENFDASMMYNNTR